MELLQQVGEALVNGDHLQTAALVKRAVDDGVPAGEIIDRGLLAGMDVVGERFGAHEIFLPDVLLAARAMKAGMDIVKPLLTAGEKPTRGTVVLGTVKGWAPTSPRPRSSMPRSPRAPRWSGCRRC